MEILYIKVRIQIISNDSLTPHDDLAKGGICPRQNEEKAYSVHLPIERRKGDEHEA